MEILGRTYCSVKWMSNIDYTVRFDGNDMIIRYIIQRIAGIAMSANRTSSSKRYIHVGYLSLLRGDGDAVYEDFEFIGTVEELLMDDDVLGDELNAAKDWYKERLPCEAYEFVYSNTRESMFELLVLQCGI